MGMSNPNAVEVSGNLLQKSKFLLSFNRIPNFMFFCQKVDLPGISVQEASQATPFVDSYSAGNKAIYEAFTCTVLVDENMRSWWEIHNWMRGLTLAAGFKDPLQVPALTTASKYSDATLTILTNSNVPNIRVNFYNCFPSIMDKLSFDVRDTPDDIMTFDVRFRYFYYDPFDIRPNS